MKQADIKKLETADARKEITTLSEKLRTLRFSAMGSRAKDGKEPARIKKTIARLQTELRARA